MNLGTALKKRLPEVIQIGSDPIAASAKVANRFWRRCRDVVVAVADDPEAIILGSALAAGRGEPMLLCGREELEVGVSTALTNLSAQRLLVAVSDVKTAPHWLASVGAAYEILPPRLLMRRVIAAMGADKIRNVVVARAPDARASVGNSAWLAPYASFARGAAVVLTHGPGAAVAESDVRELIRDNSIQPRTVTLLADYASIGCRSVELDVVNQAVGRERPPVAEPPVVPGSPAARAPPAPYVVRTEPFLPIQPNCLAPFGVGRIPLDSLGDASVFFARGLLRERLLAERTPRLLMIANSGVLRRPLPLCETISRLTAAEFKNFGIHVDEFYGKPSDSPEVLSAARSAQLILYEGHVSYQEVIDEPILKRIQGEYYPWEEDEAEESAGAADGAAAGNPATAPRVLAADPIGGHLQGPLDGLPIVVLQSCESLDDAVLWRLDELGGAALIGSMTPIHSGCGSALLNAAMSSMLYRGSTLGEALCDAENYMFCVEELKARRGHTEMAKGVRVALSFRLWGDPELQVLPMSLGRPRQAPVRAQWIADDAVRIDLPESRLPPIRNDKYAAHLFPDSQVAGLLKTTEGEPVKTLSPFYYFCLPLPAALARNEVAAIQVSRSEARRVDARIDRDRGVLSLVYFPERENPGGSIIVRLRGARDQSRRPAK